jgi:hypothetical protein
LVIGFYRNAEHAEEALHEARKNRFRHSVVVHRVEDGRLKYWYGRRAPAGRATIGVALAVFLAVVAEAFGANPPLMVFLAGCAFLLTWFCALRLGFGVPKKVLSDYGRFVLPGESLVVVQETEERTADVIAILRHISHPSVFAIRPGLETGASIRSDEMLREPYRIEVENGGHYSKREIRLQDDQQSHTIHVSTGRGPSPTGSDLYSVPSSIK